MNFKKFLITKKKIYPPKHFTTLFSNLSDKFPCYLSLFGYIFLLHDTENVLTSRVTPNYILDCQTQWKTGDLKLEHWVKEKKYWV